MIHNYDNNCTPRLITVQILLVSYTHDDPHRAPKIITVQIYGPYGLLVLISRRSQPLRKGLQPARVV